MLLSPEGNMGGGGVLNTATPQKKFNEHRITAMDEMIFSYIILTSTLN